MRRTLIVGLAIVLLLVGAGYALRFDYVSANGQALRVNRFTGQTEVLRAGQGWKPIRVASTRAPWTAEQRAAYNREMARPLAPGEDEWERRMKAEMAALPDKR